MIYSEEAERGVLGSILLDAEKALDLCSDNMITAESFYVPTHRSLYEVLCSMEGETIDMLTVGEKLKEMGRLDTVGGFLFLEGLVDDTPTAAHAEYYIGFVRQKELRRNTAEIAKEAVDKCREDSDEKAEEILASLSEKLTDIVTHREEKSPVDYLKDNKMVLHNAVNGITSGVPLPWKRFSERTGGLQRGSVIPFLGRDGKGKSGAIAQCMDFWAGERIPSLVFSFEDVPRRVLLRMAGCREWFSARDAETGFTMTERGLIKMGDYHQWQIDEKIDKYSEFIADKPFFIEGDHMTAEEIYAKVSHHKRVHGIEVVVIDAFKDILHSEGSNETNCEAHISKILQKCAKKFDVAMPVISHLHDLPDDTPISMRNINGSKVQKKGARQGIIFQDAGVEGVDGETTFAIQNAKSNYGRAGYALLQRDPSVLYYSEVDR